MTTFADLAGAVDDSAPVKKSGTFYRLAAGSDQTPDGTVADVVPDNATFSGDLNKMRATFASWGEKGAPYIKALDAQQKVGAGRGVTPASAYWPPAQPTSTANPAPVIPQLLKPDDGSGTEGLFPATASLATKAAGATLGGLAGLVGAVVPGPNGQGAQWSENVQNTFAPLANWFAPPDSPAADREAGANKILGIVPELGNRAGEKVVDLGGSPGLATAANVAVNAVPMLFGMRGKAGAKPTAYRVTDDGAVVRADPATVSVAPTLPPRTAIGSGGSAAVQTNPYPVLTGEVSARGQFPQIKTSNIAADVPAAEQALRAQVANEIVGNDQVRPGVANGNIDSLRTEHTQGAAANPSPAQQALKSQIAAEQVALDRYAQDRITATGADQTKINPEQRGAVVNDAINAPLIQGEEPASLTAYLKAAKDDAYRTAREQSSTNPIATTHVDAIMQDPQFQAGATFGKTGDIYRQASTLLDLAKTTGLKDPVTGTVYAPGSAAAIEAVKHVLNQHWEPGAAATTIRTINQALDRDISASPSAPLFKQGDAIHAVEKNITQARGWKQAFGSEDENGVKSTGTPNHQLLQKMADMPPDQFRHIHDVLSELAQGRVRGAPANMPPVPQGLANSAQAALNEIHGQLAREVYQAGSAKAGVWNQNSANNVLNSTVGEKIAEHFPPEELAKFHTLNLGGQIMPGVHSYEGAGHQITRLSQPGWIENWAPKAGSYAGGMKLGVPGHIVGEQAGNMLSNMFAKKRMSNEAESVNQAMRQTSAMGQKP